VGGGGGGGGGKGGRCLCLITLSPSYADCLEIWEPEPPGTLMTCSRNCFTFYTHIFVGITGVILKKYHYVQSEIQKSLHMLNVSCRVTSSPLYIPVLLTYF